MVRPGLAPGKGLVISVRHVPQSGKVAPESGAAVDGRHLPGITIDGRLSFFHTFGSYGIPMALIALLCVVWTLFLIVLTIKPNTMANYLTNTAAFDDGTFWLIIEPDAVLVVLSVLALSIIVLDYTNVILQMTLLRGHKIANPSIQSHIEMVKAATRRRLSSLELANQRIIRRSVVLICFHRHYKTYWNVWLKLADFTIQTLSLYQLMERGYPQILVYCYAGLVTINAILYAIGVLTPRHHSAFGEVLIDSIFDMLLAVGFPIIVFAYCFSHFQLDRAVILLNMEIFPVGAFSRNARMASDPAQIALFQLLFDSLRIQTPLDFVLRIGMNLSICYRFKRVIQMLVELQQAYRQPLRTLSGREHRVSSGHVNTHQQLPRSVALLVLAFSIVLTVATYEAVESSRERCEAYPECVAYAYRWRPESSNAFCPCIALVDADRVPTQQEWDFPVDVTDKVQHLALSGDLQVLYIVNRRMVDLPVELQRCTNMRHITLFYTESQSIPSWAKHFHKLEYLHLQGKPAATNLITLPEDLFASMASLAFIHIASHNHLPALPSFHGLVSLQSLSLALLPSIESLPSFASNGQLERLEIQVLPAVKELPDLAPLQRLVSFAFVGRGLACCNGFLDSVCNLSHPFCLADADSNYPQATCLTPTDPHASNATQRLFQTFAGFVCVAFQGSLDNLSSYGSQEGVANICDNVAYRQCPLNINGDFGICVSTHMMVIQCNYSPFFIIARRKQIELSIGDACNPDEEAWLGCHHAL